jgi:hypothetical protein
MYFSGLKNEEKWGKPNKKIIFSIEKNILFYLTIQNLYTANSTFNTRIVIIHLKFFICD